MTTVDLGHLDGAAAVPRSNGELVFEQPWEGTAFGLAVALAEEGVIEWEDFRARLIARIAEAEADAGSFSYYACWMAALQDVLTSTAQLSERDILTRAHHIVTTELEHGDHDHDHDH